MTAATSGKVITGKVRFSFAKQLYVPKANDKGINKYSVTALIPKTDKATYQRMCDAAEFIKRSKFPGKDEDFYKAQPRTIHDGDGVKPSTGEKYGAECKGCWVVSVASNERPEVVDADTQPLLEQINSGDYGRVSLNAYWFDTGANKGVTFGLNNVQLLERGERIDGRTDAVTDFGEF